MITNPAIIVGNGISRKDVSFEQTKGIPVFGCNLFYKEQLPNFLVAIDPLMIQQIKTDKPNCTFIETPQDKQFEPAEYNPNRPRENAGMIAMSAAISLGFNTLYLYGFDFVLEDKDANMSNVFDGQAGYGPETRCSFEDSRARCGYFKWFADKHPSTSFTFLFPPKENYLVRIPPQTNISYQAIPYLND